MRRMQRRGFLVGAAAFLLAPRLAVGQAPGKVYRIAYLAESPVADRTLGLSRLLIEALRELGYVEGTNLLVDYRWSEGDYSKYPQLLDDLIRLKPDVILASGQAARAAKEATKSIPIVMVNTRDPVKFGTVASLAHPGGNVTGVAFAPVDWGKWLELAKEAMPGLSRIGIIANPNNAVYATYVADNEEAARKLGLSLQIVRVGRAEDLDPAFAVMNKARTGALIVGPDALYTSVLLERILRRSSEARLPTIFAFSDAARAGALISYGTDFRHILRRAAIYVDRILKGAKPADLPVEQPTKFELIVNLKVADELGLAIPPSLLLRADDVIK